jgi:DNA-binding transcriptional regulator YiaG
MTALEILDVIDAERIKRKITWDNFASMCGMSYSTVKKWKTGRNEPTMHCLSVLAEGVGLELKVCKKHANM